MADGKIDIELDLNDSKAASKAQKAGKDISKGVESGLKDIGKSADKAQKDIEKPLQNAAKSAKSSFADVGSAAKSGFSDVGDAAKSAADDASSAFEEVPADAKGSFSDVGDSAQSGFSGVVNAAETAADGVDDAFADVGDSMDSASDHSFSFGAAVVAAGNMAAEAITLVISKVGEFITNSIEAGKEFDKSMSQVAATMGKTTDEIGELTDFAKEMGAKTAFSATQASEALNYMALAGYDAKTSMDMLPVVLNLAAAGNMQLATASDMVTDAQSALGLSLEQTVEMVDQMAMTSSKTNTSVEQLGNAFLTVGGTAKNLSGGTKELAQMLGILADNGIKGSEGGTALRNVILSLSAPTDTAKGKIEDLGLAVFDASGNMRPLPDIMNDLNAAMEPLTQQEKTEALNTIFNKVDLKSVNALLGTSADRFDEVAASIDNAQGSAQKMADTQLDNFAGDVTLLDSAMEGLAIQISDALNPALRAFTQFLTNAIVPALSVFVANLDKIVPLVGSLGVSLLTLKVAPAIFTKMSASVKTASTTVSILGKEFKLTGVAAKVAGTATKAFATASKALKASLPVLALTAAVEAAMMLADAFNDAKGRADTLKKATDGIRKSSDAFSESYDKAASSMNNASSSVDSYSSKLSFSAQRMQEVINKQAELSDSISETWSDAGTNAAMVDTYADTIQRLTNKYGEQGEKIRLTASEQAELTAAVDGLNSIMGTSYSVVDAQNGVLSANTSEILKNADAWNKKALAEAASQINTDLMKQRIETQRELTAATRELELATKTMQETDDPEMWKAASASAEHYKGIVDDLTGALNAVDDEIAENNQVVQEMTEAYDSTSMAIASFVEQNNIWSESLGNASISADEFSSKLSDMGVSTAELAQIMTEQGQAGIDGFVAAYQGGTESLAAWLDANGYTIPQSMANGMAKGEGAVSSESNKIAGIAEDGMSSVDADGIGSDKGHDYASGIGSAEGDTSSNAGQLSQTAELEMTKGDSYSWGSDLGSQFAAGIQSAWRAVTTAASNIASAVASFLHFSAPKEGPWSGAEKGGITSGIHLAQNFAKGLSSDKAKHDIRKASEDLAVEMNDALKAEFGSVNPMAQLQTSIMQGSTALNMSAMNVGAAPSYTTYEQNITNEFNQPIRSPADIERMQRLSNIYQLEVDRAK